MPTMSSRMELNLVSMNTAALYQPLNDVPGGFVGERRFVHVIGTTVFVDDRAEDEAWPQHFIGIVDGIGWWAIDVPDAAGDPSYGAAMDLYRYFGAASEAEWLAAGRAVQVAEWVRTHRFCGRCATPTGPSAGGARAHLPGVRTRCLSARRARDDHLDHSG